MTNETHISGDYIQGDKIGGDKIERDKIVHIHDGAPPDFPLHNLPPANPHFTGRAALLQAIAANFAQSSIVNRQSPIVIAGLGGVGKTQLALAYAHAHQGDYDLIWLLPANDTPGLDNSLRQLGTVLRLPMQTADAPTARQMVLSWLNGTDKRWLLLYDNADKIEARDLRPYLPGGGGHILITSRRPTWRAARALPLDVFTAEEAADFWRRRLVQSSRLNQSPLAELARELGRLPLALEQAAAYMQTRSKTAAQYLALYRERRRELWQRETPPDDYHATILTTWQMAFDHARHTPGAAALLNLCCFLAPDNIPLEVITAHANALPEELAAVAGDELALDDALDALQAYSLLARANGTLSIHRLVQAVAREQMGAERAKIWVEATTKLIVAALPDWTRLHEWEEGRLILSHMIAAANIGVEIGWETAQLAFLCNWIGYYLQFLANYAEARPYYERALAIREKALGPDHPDTAQSLNNLGYLLQAMGNLAEARPHYERALAIREKALGPDHPDTASSLNNLGALLRAMGKLAEARPYYERALAINEKALGPDHSATATSLNNLGLLLQTMGHLAEARPYYERALAINEKALGPDHPDTALSLNNLGYLLRALGDLAGARPHYERALAIREKALGPDHPDTARSLNNLGYLLRAMGKLAEARPYYEQALAINQKALGPDHPDTALSLNNLGALLDSMGNLAQARPYYERALAIYEKALGPDHPDTARSLNNLGYLLQAMGNLAEAQPYYERALAIYEKALVSDHPDTASSLNNLGYLLQALGNLAQARPYYERALAIAEARLGKNHPHTKIFRNNLQSLP